MATVQERLTSLINAANTTTGKTDVDMTAATQSLIDGFGGGGGGGTIVIPGDGTPNYSKMFTNADFAGNSIWLQSKTAANFSSCFVGAKNLKTVKIDTTASGLVFGTVFNNSSVEMVDMSDSSCDFNAYSKTTFNNCPNLTEIKGELNFSKVISGEIIFYKLSKLVEFRLKPNSVNTNFSFTGVQDDDTQNLSAASLQSIVDGLNTVSEAKTLKMGDNYVKRFTPEQRSAIAAKNWNLV